eukprot:gene28481-31632_t
MSDANSSQASGSFIHTKGDTTDNKSSSASLMSK